MLRHVVEFSFFRVFGDFYFLSEVQEVPRPFKVQRWSERGLHLTLWCAGTCALSRGASQQDNLPNEYVTLQRLWQPDEACPSLSVPMSSYDECSVE